MSKNNEQNIDDGMKALSQSGPRLRIALVCDFFYPRLGGVEMHIWSLSQLLIRQGHKVIVITHAYDDRKGVRYLPGPLKVYYCPIVPMVDQDALPSFTATLPLLRWIWIRERINVVHAHQATSTMANESLVYASTLGIPTVYTDHSLFGFDDVASLVLNRVLQTTLSTASAIICVSYTCRDNLVLRARIANAKSRVRVIPNAVDPSKFTPNACCTSEDDVDMDRATSSSVQSNNSNTGGNNSGRIIVVVVSRLVYRKGVDLLVGIIPIICRNLPQVDFLLGGDGVKRLALEEMVERERLQERVEFLGAVPHNQVLNVLTRGHVFLNCSLTESFCIALLEAASCGLLVVSTNVGGVPEVLPSPDIMLLADPNVPSLVENLTMAIGRHEKNPVDPWEMHNRVAKMYSWGRVAKQTTVVYDKVLLEQQENPRSFLQRLECYRNIGGITGLIACLLAMMVEFWVNFVEWWQPREIIDVVPDLLPRPHSTEDKSPIM